MVLCTCEFPFLTLLRGTIILSNFQVEEDPKPRNLPSIFILLYILTLLSFSNASLASASKLIVAELIKSSGENKSLSKTQNEIAGSLQGRVIGNFIRQLKEPFQSNCLQKLTKINNKKYNMKKKLLLLKELDSEYQFAW